MALYYAQVMDRHIIAEIPAIVRGEVTVEAVPCGPKTIQVVMPAKPERLLDLTEVAQAYDRDQYMPYWATIWPVARMMAKDLLTRPVPGARTAIELGCGLGLPGLAALLAGWHVTFTDYDETALRFCERNAALNGFGADRYRTIAVDWRSPIPERFDVVLASDLLYEARNTEPLVASFAKLLAPGGTVIVADQDRAHIPAFKEAMHKQKYVYDAVQEELDPKSGIKGRGTVYRVKPAN